MVCMAREVLLIIAYAVDLIYFKLKYFLIFLKLVCSFTYLLVFEQFKNRAFLTNKYNRDTYDNLFS